MYIASQFVIAWKYRLQRVLLPYDVHDESVAVRPLAFFVSFSLL